MTTRVHGQWLLHVTLGTRLAYIISKPKYQKQIYKIKRNLAILTTHATLSPGVLQPLIFLSSFAAIVSKVSLNKSGLMSRA